MLLVDSWAMILLREIIIFSSIFVYHYVIKFVDNFERILFHINIFIYALIKYFHKWNIIFSGNKKIIIIIIIHFILKHLEASSYRLFIIQLEASQVYVNF